MKKNIERPWLSCSGVEIPTVELKEICKKWDASTWESYLKWYQSGRREALIEFSTFQEICDQQFETIFESFARSVTPAKRRLVERLLSQLPSRESEILRASFLEGRTQVEIAAEFRFSQPRVCQLKNNALMSLKRGLAGDKLIARRFMKGASDYHHKTEEFLWDQKMVPPIKDTGVYSPNNFSKEIRFTKNHSVREALLELSQATQKIIFLRYWCTQSFQQIAKNLQWGTNLINQINDSSVTKIKRTIVQYQTGLEL